MKVEDICFWPFIYLVIRLFTSKHGLRLVCCRNCRTSHQLLAISQVFFGHNIWSTGWKIPYLSPLVASGPNQKINFWFFVLFYHITVLYVLFDSAQRFWLRHSNRTTMVRCFQRFRQILHQKKKLFIYFAIGLSLYSRLILVQVFFLAFCHASQ